MVTSSRIDNVKASDRSITLRRLSLESIRPDLEFDSKAGDIVLNIKSKSAKTSPKVENKNAIIVENENQNSKKIVSLPNSTEKSIEKEISSSNAVPESVRSSKITQRTGMTLVSNTDKTGRTTNPLIDSQKKNKISDGYMKKIYELMSIDDKELWNAMSVEDRYKESSADWRLSHFKKQQTKMDKMKEEYLEELQKTGRKVPTYINRHKVRRKLIPLKPTFTSKHTCVKPLIVAGEAMNETQERLAGIGADKNARRISFIAKNKTDFGELSQDPAAARRMLTNISLKDIDHPDRSSDVRSTIDWRLNLRF